MVVVTVILRYPPQYVSNPSIKIWGNCLGINYHSGFAVRPESSRAEGEFFFVSVELDFVLARIPRIPRAVDLFSTVTS